jgi:hypothetical protein
MNRQRIKDILYSPDRFPLPKKKRAAEKISAIRETPPFLSANCTFRACFLILFSASLDNHQLQTMKEYAFRLWNRQVHGHKA